MSLIKVLLLSICILSFKGGLSSQIDLSVENIDESLLDNANSVVRFQNTKVYYKSITEIETHFSTAVTVLNKRAEDDLTVVVGYKESSSKVKDFVIQIFDKSGKFVDEYKKSDIKDQILDDGISMISDYRGKVFSYKAFKYPLTIKYEYKLLSESTAGIRGFHPIRKYKQSIESASYKIINSTSTKIFIKENAVDDFGIEKLGAHHYSLQNMPAITSERFAPSISEIIPSVSFFPAEFSFEKYKGKANNWRDIGTWYYESFLGDNMDLSKSTAKTDLDHYVQAESTTKEKVEQIYQFVQDNTRYINISLEEGGLKPLSASDVHNLKYGDCKALSLYMQSLLKLYDIPSNYIIIEAGRSSKDSFDEEYFSLAQGNHIIVNVPIEQDTIWLECTSNKTPAGFLGAFTDGRRCLEVNANGGKLVSTPDFDISENYTLHKADITADLDGAAAIKLTSNFKGLSVDKKLGLEDLKDEDFEDYFKEKRFPNLKNIVLNKKILAFNAEGLKYTEDYEFSAERYVELAANYMIVDFQITDLKVPFLPKDNNRKNRINFERSYKVESEVNYHIPNEFIIKHIPESISLSSDFGSYSLSIEKIGEQEIKVIRSFSLFEGNYEQDKYEEIKSFFDKVIHQENSELIFEKK